MAHVVSVNVSDKKGVVKSPVPSIHLVPEEGVEGDAHAGPWHRQVSLLAAESIEHALETARGRQQAAGGDEGEGPQVGPGAFAENITVQGLDLPRLPVGTRVQVGEAVLEVTQIGKECHGRCAIYYQIGDCVMPREGIFARVIRGGRVSPSDNVNVIEGDD